MKTAQETMTAIKAYMQRHRQLAVSLGAGAAVVLGIAAAWLSHKPVVPQQVAQRADIEAVVRDYILAHPEIIPQAMERYRDNQSRTAYSSNKEVLETPFASAWAGNEKGDVTLVMFSDYACGYCRSSLPDLDRLVADDPKLKVVWREIPILGPGSEVAAKAALAAARQGQFREFHEKMFASGRPDGDKVSAVLRSMKLDLRQVQKDFDGDEVKSEIRRNMEIASRIDEAIATPTFVVNGQLMKGAVGYDALKQAIADARRRNKA